MNNNIEHWDNRFLDLAEFISNWSKDPSTKVGAVIVDSQNRIVSVGYNGFPRLINDDDRLNERNLKYDIIIHGEINAILFANKSLENCTLYTYPFIPCSKCASIIIQSGITKVVSYKNMPERWKDSFKLSQEILTEGKIQLVLYDKQ